MESLPMGQFVDFVLTSGTGKATIVRQLQQHRTERFADFYKPVREAIVDMHQKGDSSHLDSFLGSLVEPREKRIFPTVVNGYRKFLRQGRITWFEPPMRDYPLGPVTVRVLPEVGLLIEGRPHAIQLYTRPDALAPQRVFLATQLLHQAFNQTWPGTVYAVLDVRRGKLFPHRPHADVPRLLRAEAACFSSLWSSLG